MPDVTIGYVTWVVVACAVTNQSRCLEPGSQVTGNGLPSP